MDAAAILSVKERLLRSAAFRRAGRLRRFLEYVIEEELAGRGERLKEYTIGVGVFERRGDFDPRIDTIVRVEAIKLRERLESYFRSEGTTEPVRILIPKGSYRPVFEVHEERPESILDDPESFFWQVKSLVLKYSPEHYRRALRLARVAIERWPANAKMHALLAEVAAGATCSDIGFIAPSEGLPLMLHSARRALELDPDSAAGHMFSGIADLRLADKSGAEAAARRALTLAPDDANLHHWAAVVLLTEGKFNEAMLHARQAARLRPDILQHRMRTAHLLFLNGRSDAGLGHLRDILAFEPNDYAANLLLSRALCKARRFDEAPGPAARAFAVAPGPKALLALGYAEACAGRHEAANSIVAKLQQQAKTEYVPASGLALINIAQGRMDHALANVAAASRQGDFNFSWTKVDPRWEPLRGRAGL